MVLNSKNMVVKMMTNMGINGTHSVMDRNLRSMESRFSMEVYNVCTIWEQKYNMRVMQTGCLCKLDNYVSGEIDVKGLFLKKESVNQLLTFCVPI